MNLNHILLLSLVFGLFLGCSDRSDISSDLKKKQDVVFSETRPISDVQKRERKIIEQCNGKVRCVCDSIQNIDFYEYNGEKYFCNRDNVLKRAIPLSSNERGVKKILPILEESHNHCKGKTQYNECFCKKSNFSGSVTIGNTKYLCR